MFKYELLSTTGYLNSPLSLKSPFFCTVLHGLEFRSKWLIQHFKVPFFCLGSVGVGGMKEEKAINKANHKHNDYQLCLSQGEETIKLLKCLLIFFLIPLNVFLILLNLYFKSDNSLKAYTIKILVIILDDKT